MIRYSSYGATNFRPPSAPTDLDPLKAEYRGLLELRERVRAAEEAAAQRATFRKPGKRRSSSTMVSPASRMATALDKSTAIKAGFYDNGCVPFHDQRCGI